MSDKIFEALKSAYGSLESAINLSEDVDVEEIIKRLGGREGLDLYLRFKGVESLRNIENLLSLQQRVDLSNATVVDPRVLKLCTGASPAMIIE
jgi:hypothetical protein